MEDEYLAGVRVPSPTYIYVNLHILSSGLQLLSKVQQNHTVLLPIFCLLFFYIIYYKILAITVSWYNTSRNQGQRSWEIENKHCDYYTIYNYYPG